MFEYVLLNSPDLILSNICSIKKYIIILYYYGMFQGMGVAKTKTGLLFFNEPYSKFFYIPTLKI